ncbi:MAG: hypothetical protein P1P83_06900 [Bacteroidales bacterium]|nr:hypothetical protein [Bacteroidales bacterium]MDT8374962.1 hypothetical protein [Bacteroidales bacterium]
MKEKDKDKRLLIPKDEFGEEAAEGLGRLSRDEAAEDLRELSDRLERRLERRVSRPRRLWLPAAAAVVTVLVASALYVSLFRDSGEREPAVAMADKKMADSASVAMAEEADTDTALIAMTAPIEKGDASGSADRESMRRADMKTAEAVSAPLPEEMAAAGVPPVVVTDDEVLEVVSQARHEEPGPEKVIVEASQLPKGQVPAAEEVVVEALPTVQQEEAVAGEVIVDAVPMMQKTVLRADDAEKDKAARKREAARTAVESDTVRPDGPAQPVGGWEALNDWTRPNISHAGELTTAVNRLVVMNFKVKTDSTLYDIKVLKTPGDSYTREALWLLREGPKWTPAVRDGQVVEEKVTVSIVFK